MKFKDYFNKLKEQGKIKNDAFDNFIENVPEGEMPDEIFPILDSTFLTTERALSHKDVAGKIKREVLDIVDNDLKQYYKLLPAETVLNLEKEENTFKKSAMLREALPAIIAGAAKAPNDEEAKKKIAEQIATIQELTDKFSKLDVSHKDALKGAQDQYEKQFKDYKLNSELEKLTNSYTFADAFRDTRSGLTKAILGEIKAKNKLDLIEKDGEYQISVFDENGSPRFDGNTPITINSLLEPAIKPFLKVSNVEQPQQQKQQSFRVDQNDSGLRRGGNVQVAV